jgi:wyosine [tRNA(Phe)-imidazoG37] synthetase (radical SAM superfamily)
MKYVYGPVPSRRLGQSLGIDPIPLKTCNWNCVYCQLGRTRPVTNQRSLVIQPEEILDEVERALEEHEVGEIDWITIVGSGEPTLNLGVGWLIREVQKITPIPVAVITNGSLCYLSEVRGELGPADAVMPSLDAGTPDLYRRINRPHPEVTFQRHVAGLERFAAEYDGALWLEVMLLRGLNDTEAALNDLAEVIERIKPDEIHLNLPARPPVETWVHPPDEEGLLRARAILGEKARLIQPIDGEFDLGSYEHLVEAVVGIIQRHPMRREELERTLAQWAPGKVEQALRDLAASGEAQIIKRYGVQFWSAAPAYFPDEEESARTQPEWRKEQTANKD